MSENKIHMMFALSFFFFFFNICIWFVFLPMFSPQRIGGLPATKGSLPDVYIIVFGFFPPFNVRKRAWFNIALVSYGDMTQSCTHIRRVPMLLVQINMIHAM